MSLDGREEWWVRIGKGRAIMLCLPRKKTGIDHGCRGCLSAAWNHTLPVSALFASAWTVTRRERRHCRKPFPSRSPPFHNSKKPCVLFPRVLSTSRLFFVADDQLQFPSVGDMGREVRMWETRFRFLTERGHVQSNQSCGA